MAGADVIERAKAELLRRRAEAELAGRKNTPRSEQPSQEHNFTFLPMKWDKEGKLAFPAMPSIIPGMIEGAKNAYAAPYRAYTGELPMTDESGRTSDEAIAAGFDMATLAGPSSVALRAGEKVIPGVANNLVPAENALSADALKAAARQGYDGAQELGVEFSPEAVKNLADSTLQDLFTKGFVDETAPRTTSLLKRVGDVPQAAADELVTAPLTSVEAARRGLNNAARNFNNPPDAEAARLARQKLDGFLREPPDGAVLSGDAQAASQLYREADKNWAAAKKSDLLTGAEEAADLRAAAANSGQNAGNTTRQRIASVLLNNKTASRFSPDEKEALEGVVRGTKAENATRMISNLLAGGGGVGAGFMGAGAGTLAAVASQSPSAALLGVVPVAAGYGMRQVSNALTKRHLNDVEEAIRAAAPASRKAAEDIPAEVMRERAKEMIMRSLMRQRPYAPDAEFMDKWLAGDAA